MAKTGPRMSVMVDAQLLRDIVARAQKHHSSLFSGVDGVECPEELVVHYALVLYKNGFPDEMKEPDP